MKTPVFEEIDPASDCDCPGCAHWRLVLPHSAPHRPSVHLATRRVLALAAVTSTALGVGHTVPALAAVHAPLRPGVPAGDEPQSPQGNKAPLHGPAGTPAKPSEAGKTPEITRAEIIERAQKWVDAKVPYSMTSYWEDGYRQDCSGFVSMAWSLPQNEWTGSLHTFGTRITKAELQPGDMLLFHNPDNPQNGSHVVLFGGWVDSSRTYYVAYESTRPHARRLTTPYAYWTNSSRYIPYRYKGVVEIPPETPPTTPPATPPTIPPVTPPETPPAIPPETPTMPSVDVPQDDKHAAAPYPGRAMFRPGANNPHVTQLGRQLVKKGFGRYYPNGPGPRWGEADRRGVEAFQRTQGWRGGAADGYPGPETWRRLFF
ncbi:peptidoglycan-binding protein [Streptomyces spinoverrucosus]|uniref:peptidoglycan-binding protein n=1 Tax=Streptomyces spinoverrucosus TaxID=284043 RepID=UPI0018C3E573|nr:peptidoglycan-binding protein [Streptomyces spinoverrucosus]MBG0854980.1 peptidoglycan-binding protein [Streptomyces spinoverrucosus]